MKKLLHNIVVVAFILVMILSIVPSFSYAATSTEAVVLEKQDGTKMIYVKDVEDSETDFTFAFSNNNDDEDSLSYETCVLDGDGKKVAYVDGEISAKYMYVKTPDGTKVVDLEATTRISEEGLNKVGNFTQTISIDATQSETTDDNSTRTYIVTTVGKIVITDEEDSYDYDMYEIVDNNGSADSINEDAKALYDGLKNMESLDTMFDKLSNAASILEKYNALFNSASWKNAENKEIFEPDDAVNDEYFLVLIKGNDEDDLQIMKSVREDDEGTTTTPTNVTKQVEKKSLLPKTGEDLILYIALGIIVVSIIAVSIKIKNVKGKDNEE